MNRDLILWSTVLGGPLVWMILCGGVLYPWLFLLALSRTTATNTALRNPLQIPTGS